MSASVDGHLSFSTDNVSNRPNRGLQLDPLTDLFNTMHVASVVHSRLEATAPWGLMRGAEDANESVAHSSALGSLPSQFAPFGLVARGHCWLSGTGIPDPLSRTRGLALLVA